MEKIGIEKKTPQEILDFAVENLDNAGYSFAVFVDAIKRWNERLKNDKA